MQQRPNNWFLSMYSTEELLHILFNYFKDVHGVSYAGDANGRCSVVNALENLDAYTARYHQGT